jgi:photosystem II stability/assembly factor-like uncharacterized protein
MIAIKTSRIQSLPFFLLLLMCIAACRLTAANAQNSDSGWRSNNLPFRVVNTTSIGQSQWICGTDESIAVSSDGGEHWRVKHQTTDGAVLLNIAFANDKFGYAAGTGGVLLTTEDSGETWSSHSAGKDPILGLSFSDPKHGLIQTFNALLFTVDGATTWTAVSAGQNSEEMKRFSYPFSLVALDSAHMAIMLKQGSAQYEPQAFLFTQDSGKSWNFLNIPNVTLYSFLRAQGRYRTVGTEVIHKGDKGGGYSVPVALSSADGENWEHSSNDLTECQLQMCVACNTEGCLSANGTITNFFADKTTYKDFSATRQLTTKWSAAGSTICFVANGLHCSHLAPVAKPSPSDIPLPIASAPGPLNAVPLTGPHCIVCTMDRILIDQKAQGAYTIKLALEIGKNGTVKSATAEGAPTQEAKSRIEQQAQEWIFEPYLKDGTAVNLKLNTAIHVNVIKPR